MASRKTTYDIEREQLRKMGHRPESMTIRQQFEALGGKADGRSLWEVAGLERSHEPERCVTTTGAQMALF